MPLLPAAVGIVLNADQTQILLIKRHDVPVWVLPGGGIEKEERPEEALIREIQEETGYQVKIIRKCAEYYPINRLAAFTSVFICQIQKGQACLSSETAAIAFHPLANLPTTLFPPHARWIQEVLTSSTLIQRRLTEISYCTLCLYFLRHPWQTLRFAWTRFTKT
jgi:8-oxo-dGTP pyrophosphatase MutT (NUDIX family)